MGRQNRKKEYLKITNTMNMIKPPPQRYINITITESDLKGCGLKSYNEEINFNREISASLLYTKLQKIARAYYKDCHLSIKLQDIENWLIQMKALAFTADLKHDGFIPEAGLTIATIKRKEGQDDIFIEYAFII